MHLLFTVLVTFFAGMGAGLGTGFAGMSAAAVISPHADRAFCAWTLAAVGIAAPLGSPCQRGVCLLPTIKQESGHQKRPEVAVAACLPL